MKLTTAQTDRAAGVLLGQACGDALGVPYEFARPPGPGEPAEMIGGGLGNGAPGEWSDDTAMAMVIAEVAATGADLRTEAALDAIAEGFLGWYADGPPDIGIQTRAVLGAASRRIAAGERGASKILTEEAAGYAVSNPRSAGNGALMRTSPVALAYLDDRNAGSEAARLVARLTHGDPLAGDACVLWSEAIRVAVLDARFDVAGGLDLIPQERRDQWAGWLAAPSSRPARFFTPNGFAVMALQAALAAIEQTPVSDTPSTFPCLHLQEALHAAVRIGDDTDTVAAIAGGLLGAHWGASAVPWRWRRVAHGWPGRDGRDLVATATLIVRGGAPDGTGWPLTDDVGYDDPAETEVIAHPADPGVLLGTHRSRAHGATAVVAACRVGRAQACHDGAAVLVESRLIDSEDPAANPNLAFALYDAADAVRGLREEGHTVFVHCVAAQQRTPSIAAAYGVLTRQPLHVARDAVTAVLPSTRGSGSVWNAVAQVAVRATVRTSIAFAAQVGGFTISYGPPPPDSPLAHLAGLVDRQEAGELTADEVLQIMCRLHPSFGAVPDQHS